ncbi:Rapamycin-insensitive companion of mTOR, N-term-domain-containing protein [Pholiota molesta]|nr:Rapamycin-insensitive companion of mTOR, N-term-domain-containing protein [Pholiota molesta]
MPANLAIPPVAGSHISFSGATLVNTWTGDASFSFAQLEGLDPLEQVDALNNELVLEKRIKEGAENLLDMDLTPGQRLKVESELDIAKTKISAIQRRIDLQSSRVKDKSNISNSGATKRKPKPTSDFTTSIKSAKEGDDKSGEGFRTALQNAVTCIRELESLVRSESSSSNGPTSPLASKVEMHSATNHDLNAQRIDAMTKLIDILRRQLRVRYELNFSEVLHAILPCFGDNCSPQCRAAAYRVIRHALVDTDRVDRLGESLDWYILKSLLRDNKCAVEKEQAIKLIRTIVEVGTVRRDAETNGGPGVVPISETVMRAIVAVAEHPEDPFRLICIQTLAEILLIDIDLALKTGVIRFLLHVLGEGPVEITPILASVFLHLVDCPRTRAYLQVGTDLETAFSAITDAYGKGPDHAERMRGCAKVVQLMLRTWSGLMFFCLDDMRAIRSLIDTLTIPSLETREIILDMFFDLLNIKTPAWYQTFIDGRRLTMYRKSRDAPENHQERPEEKTYHTLKLTDQYLALLVAILSNAGLCEALTAMLEESTIGSNLSRKATLLMAEVLAMANRVLPLTVAARIQAIPQVFCMATDYKHGENRIVGTSALSAIDSFNRNRARLEPSGPVKGFRLRANSVEDAVRRGQRQVEQVKLKMSMQMDDKTFQACLLETQVMTSPKDHSKWNFDTLQDLIEGPLLNPKRMEEAIRVSRFIRRLMSFFHPFNHRFSEMKRNRANTRWVRLGCTLLSTLMTSPEGVRYLSTEDQFLTQIKKSFAQLDPFNGVPDSDPIFSKKRMLGTLSKTKDGIELLEKFKIFTAFYHLTLTSSYKHIRHYATRHLGTLIRGSPNANTWTLRLLLTQLYDPAPEVRELAVEFLEEACDSKDMLQLVITRFMSTPMGFRFLYDAGYIDREIEAWFNGRNIDYVVEVEVFLNKVFSFTSEDEDDLLEFDGIVPAHFYGEMAKTELGCQVLQEKGHFVEFSQFIRQHSQESEDTDLILKLKSILWAVGNVGATEGGLHFCEEEEIIPAILEIAENSPIPSVRGTCFFVLGLISSTTQGAEILDDYKWEATLSPLGMPTGLCIPADIDRFISLPSWKAKMPDKSENRLLPPTSEPEIETITAIQNLANTVIANAASRSLARIKARPDTRNIFISPEMFYRALHIMSTQRYRLPVRRYIVELFNQEMNEDLASALNDAAVRLKASPSYKPPRTDTIRMSIFGRLGKSRRQSESDESDEDDGLGTPPAEVKPVVEQPTINLQPLKKIVGFAV